jgi:WD40 repeat protein
MAIHPNGQIIVSGGRDSRIFYWNLTEDPQLPVWTRKISSQVGINDIAYSDKYNYLAMGEANSAITLWDISNPTSWLTKKSFGQPPVQLAFSPTQDRLGVLTSRQENPEASVSTLNMTNLTYSSKNWLFDLNSDGYFAFGENYVLAAEDKNDDLVSIYHFDISNPLATLKGQKKLDAIACPSIDSAYAPNNDLAVVISCQIQIWDFGDDKAPVLLQSEELEKINNPRSVAFHPNGELLAMGTGDERNSIQFWSIKLIDGEVDVSPINEIMDPHLRPVTSVAFSMDGNALATGSDDLTVAVWDITGIQNPKHRFTLRGHSGPILNGGVFFSQDGKTLISAAKSEVILWNIDRDFWFDKACKIAGTNFSQQEWVEFVGDEPYHATCPDFPIPED